MRALAIAALVLACNPSSFRGRDPQVREQYEADPAWAAAYEKRAADGCDCKDAACLDRVRGELTKLETDHGGMDDAPPGVQQAHGKFDQCWRAGTKDIARDLDYAANEVCNCNDSACMQHYKLDAMHLVDKYEVAALDDLASAAPSAPATLAKLHKCIADVTIAADALLAVVQKATDAMCACDNVGCATTVMKERSETLGKYYDVDGLAGVQDRLDALQPKYCRCLGDLAAKEIADKLSPFPEATKIDVTMNCK